MLVVQGSALGCLMEEIFFGDSLRIDVEIIFEISVGVVGAVRRRS